MQLLTLKSLVLSVYPKKYPKKVSRLAVIALPVLLSGCLIPQDISVITNTDQELTVYTFTPNQRVRVQCHEWFWYDGLSQDPRWSNNYSVGWATMASGRTSTSAINPSQTSKVYAATLTVEPGDFRVDTTDWIGCTGEFDDDIEIRPLVRDGSWQSWYTMNSTGIACMTDNSQHSDDENDPDWEQRTLDCQTGTSNDYTIDR